MFSKQNKRLDPNNFSSSFWSSWDKKRSNALTLWIKSHEQEDQTSTPTLQIWYETAVKIWKKTQVTALSNIQTPVWNTNQPTEQYWLEQTAQNTSKKEITWWVWLQVTNKTIWTYGAEYANWREWINITVRWGKTFKTWETWSLTLGASNTLTKWDDNAWKSFTSNVTFQQTVGKWNLSVQGNFTQSEKTNTYMYKQNETYGWNIAYRNNKTWTSLTLWATHGTESTATDVENPNVMIKEATTTGIFSAQQTVSKWEWWWKITIWGNLKVKKWWSDTNNTPPVSWDATIRVEF